MYSLLQAVFSRTQPEAADGRTEKQKMLAGALYRAFDQTLEKERSHAHLLLERYNALKSSDDAAAATRSELLSQLLGSFPTDAPPFIEPKFRCDYGYNIIFGRHFYANFDCCILDCNTVTIGDDVFFGPGVQASRVTAFPPNTYRLALLCSNKLTPQVHYSSLSTASAPIRLSEARHMCLA
jgi:acetyltransferase-like isoleucine patch superfamily enzyme